MVKSKSSTELFSLNKLDSIIPDLGMLERSKLKQIT